MEFSNRRIDSQTHYNYVFPMSSSSSSLNYTYIPNHNMIDGLRGGGSFVPVPSGVGFPSALMLGQPLRSYHPLIESEMRLHGEPFSPSPYDLTVPIAREERYGGGGYHHRDIREFEAVPFHRLPPPSPEIKEIIVMPKLTDATVIGSKRKAPPPSSPTIAGSIRFCSKKITEEWRCAVCDITATSEHGLIDHLGGKKHQAKVESLKFYDNKRTSEIKSLKGNNVGGGDIGLGIIKTSMKKQTSEIENVTNDSKKVKKVKITNGGKMRKKCKFWCKMCKIGAYDEVVMRDHKKGKKHMKNRCMKARA